LKIKGEVNASKAREATFLLSIMQTAKKLITKIIPQAVVKLTTLSTNT